MTMVFDNGVYRNATAEEEAELMHMQSEMPPQEPSIEERVEALEREKAELVEALELLLSGVTDDGE